MRRILLVDRNYPNGKQRWIDEVPYEDRRCAECEKNQREAFFGGNDGSAVTRGEVKALWQEEAEERQQAAENTRKRNRRRPRQKPHFVRKHEQAIRDVWRSGFRGKKYFIELAKRTVPPYHWVQAGCPPTYDEIYEDPTWRRRAQQERYNVTNRNARE